MKILYTTEATVEGGRAGRGRTADGRLAVELSTPKELGGQGGPGTNPEQLFAIGYAACFQSSLLAVARGLKVDVADSAVTAHVGMVRPVAADLGWRSPSTWTRRHCRVFRRRTLCVEPTRSAPTRMPRAATWTSRSASTASR
jgi:hypothetical protein